MMHPAPRMISAPVPNRRVYFSGTDGGALSANEAMVIDQTNNHSGLPLAARSNLRRRTAWIEQ